MMEYEGVQDNWGNIGRHLECQHANVWNNHIKNKEKKVVCTNKAEKRNAKMIRHENKAKYLSVMSVSFLF